MGLQGMINEMVSLSDFNPADSLNNVKNVAVKIKDKDINTISRLISLAENNHKEFLKISSSSLEIVGNCPVLGITGTGGAGKSSLVDELVRRFLSDFPKKISLLSL